MRVAARKQVALMVPDISMGADSEDRHGLVGAPARSVGYGALVVLVGVVIGVTAVVVSMTGVVVVTVEAFVAVSAGPLPLMNSPIAVVPSDS